MKTRQKFIKFLNKYKNLTIKQQIRYFEYEFVKSRSVYFRWKKAVKKDLPLNWLKTHYRNILDKRSSCYFCNKKFGLIVHHKDKNRKNKKRDNLLVLCKRCHARLHRIMELKIDFIYVFDIKSRKVSSVSNVREKQK